MFEDVQALAAERGAKHRAGGEEEAIPGWWLRAVRRCAPVPPCRDEIGERFEEQVREGA